MWVYVYRLLIVNSLFVAVKFTKNSDRDNYSYLGYGIGIDAHGTFSLWDSNGFGKNAMIFDADMSSSVHIDNKRKDVFILCKDPIDGLDDTKLAPGK